MHHKRAIRHLCFKVLVLCKTHTQTYQAAAKDRKVVQLLFTHSCCCCYRALALSHPPARSYTRTNRLLQHVAAERGNKGGWCT